MSDGRDLAVDAAIEACAAGWDDRAKRTRAAKQLGLAIDDEAARTLTLFLDAANAKRRRYTMPLADLIRAVVEARDAGIALRHGGKGGPHAMTPSTVALAVRIDDAVHVALGTAAARSPSPGSIWKTLAPWQQDISKNVAKTQGWARGEPRKVTIPIVKQATAELRQSRVTRDAVLAEVLARPRDDEPRLVYADALTANGDPRGELIVVQCALAAGNTDPKLVKRETELRRKHAAAWTRDVKQFARACVMRRGFVAEVTMTARQFVAAAKVFDKEPIDVLELHEPDARAVALLAKTPHLARIDQLRFDNRLWIDTPAQLAQFRELLRSPHLVARHLSLAVTFGDGADDIIHTMFDDVAWPSIESLVLRIHGAGPTGRRGIPVRGDGWTCEHVWGSLCRAHIPKLTMLAISPLGHKRELAAAFPAATIHPG